TADYTDCADCMSVKSVYDSNASAALPILHVRATWLGEAVAAHGVRDSDPGARAFRRGANRPGFPVGALPVPEVPLVESRPEQLAPGVLGLAPMVAGEPPRRNLRFQRPKPTLTPLRSNPCVLS